MKRNRSIPSATVIPVLIYPDVRDAVDWLSTAFGFVERVRIGENHRSQLSLGEGAVIIGDVRNERRPPRPGEVTHSLMVRVEDAEAHCKHARAHGARIVMEPTEFEYGERQYTAEDPAGHQWTFSETLADVAPEEWGGTSVGSVTCQISISLDGFVAGPNQSVDNPIGEGGMRLHEWAFPTASWREQHGAAGGERSADAEVVDEVMQGVGAYIMGRKMFGGGDGPWDQTWTGWWGEDPPFHAPVFVLTHHAREPLTMQGGTTFTFVTDGIDSALEQARSAAGDKDIAIAGGASAVQQYLAAGLLDELYLHIVPIVLGSGERLLENVGDPTLEPANVIASPAVTHVKYRVVR